MSADITISVWLFVMLIAVRQERYSANWSVKTVSQEKPILRYYANAIAHWLPDRQWR